MRIDLKGKRALVGGSTGGIGKAIAIELSKCGASVTLMARDVQKLNKTIDELAKIENTALLDKKMVEKPAEESSTAV